ncbi:MAG: FAD-dependent monooxygenase [Parvularcula sp.]
MTTQLTGAVIFTDAHRGRICSPMSSDVIIAGAGLTGRLLALALADAGVTSTIIDPAQPGRGGHDPRTTALAYASVRMLIRLGLWDAVKDGAGPIDDILVSNGEPKDRFRRGGVSGGVLHFPSTLLPDHRRGDAQLPLGYIVNNAAMNEVFEAATADHSMISCRHGQTVDRTEIEPGRARAFLSSGAQIEAPLLVACDGKNSSLRKMLGFRTVEWDYGQNAIAFNMAHTLSHDNVAHEVFYPGGPFAILPLAGKACSIVWTETSARAASLMALPEEAFLAELENRVGGFLGTLSLASKPVSFPLRFVHVPNPVSDRVALAGDAAHTVHPIAGQGFNLGMKDIAVLGDVIGTAKKTGLDIGHGSVLEEYAHWRRFDTTAMSFGMDAMVRLFSNNIAPVRWARGLGLGLVQKMDPLRVAFMRQSGADTGTLPPLMQPL